MYLADAANVLVPAYLAILQKGYSVRRSGGYLTAQNEEHRFHAKDSLGLLGLIALAETRGASWQATDVEIDDYLSRFEE